MKKRTLALLIVIISVGMTILTGIIVTNGMKNDLLLVLVSTGGIASICVLIYKYKKTKE